MPEWMPQLNVHAFHNGDYRDAFPLGTFEARGSRVGKQAVRYVGDPIDVFGDLHRGMSVRNVTRRVSHEELGWQYGLERCGFVVLPIDVVPPRERALPAPLSPSTSIEEAEHLDRLRGVVTVRDAGREHWPAIAAGCRAAPGVWHRILGKWGSHGPTIRKGGLVAFRPAGAFEARVRDYELEVRYVTEATS